MSAPARLLLCSGCRARGAYQFGGLDQTFDNPRSAGRIACLKNFQRLPGIAHGGWIAGAFDDIMGRLASHLAPSVHINTVFCVAKDGVMHCQTP